MSILNKIRDAKLQRLGEAKARVSLSELRAMALDTAPTRGLAGAIRRDKNAPINLIAEIKHASPSKGVISNDFDHLAIAKVYDNLPVRAISVLTEEDFFQGSAQILRDVKAIVSKPVLRKDFIFEEYQIYEARAMGADALLLIAAMLDRLQSAEFIHLSMELGMDVLYEVHDERELEQALLIKAPIIGVNNRNLKTLDIDLSVSERLVQQIPGSVIKVSESGMESRCDIQRMERSGFDAVLVGTVIMKSKDRAAKVSELLGIG